MRTSGAGALQAVGAGFRDVGGEQVHGVGSHLTYVRGGTVWSALTPAPATAGLRLSRPRLREREMCGGTGGA